METLSLISQVPRKAELYRNPTHQILKRELQSHSPIKEKVPHGPNHLFYQFLLMADRSAICGSKSDLWDYGACDELRLQWILS